jgi:uncharacterized RDD family membrane protein YckC
MDVEDRLAIATPEGVRLELTLAGLGSRALAGFVDLVLKGLMIAALAIVLLTALSEGVAVALLLPIGFTILFFYDVLFETLSQGRTPGKRWAGLRVLRASGGPVDLRSSAVRNLLRIVDGILLSYVPTVIAILVTRRNQRLGDLAAGTVVVRDRRAAAAVPAPVVPAPATSGAAWDVSAVTRDDVAAVGSFLARRETFDPQARQRLAARLHEALAPKVGGADVHEPEAFLEALAAAKATRGPR